MTKLKALKDYPYDNKQRHAGDVFEASDADADTLVKIGHAEHVEPGGYQTRTVKAEGDDQAPAQPPPAHRKGRYPRRDMRADD